jgi:hypothetical protein
MLARRRTTSALLLPCASVVMACYLQAVCSSIIHASNRARKPLEARRQGEDPACQTLAENLSLLYYDIHRYIHVSIRRNK